MAIDYPVRRPTRRCAASDRELAPGEAFVSVLIDEAGDVVRRDYAASEWTAPPEGAIGWWRGLTPRSDGDTPAPREVLLGLLDEWADRPDEGAARYVLALLLVRRRVLRVVGEGFLAGLRGEATQDAGVLRLICPERDEPIEVAVAAPGPGEAATIQQRLSELLGAA